MSSQYTRNVSMLLKRAGKLSRVLYLIEKSDIPAVSIPTVVVALAISGLPSVSLFIKGVIWNQLHLLAFETKNQILGLEEDRIAKPHRPLPSGLISLEDAHILYRCLLVCMWIAAFHCNTFVCTFAYTAAITIYNEGGLAAFSGLKNVIGAFGLMCMCWGTTVTFANGEGLHSKRALAILIFGLIFSTTGHAQDFRDRSADVVMGRKTIPLVLSQPLARWSLAVMIAAWTAGLIVFWQPPMVVSIAFAILGLRTLGGYLMSDEEKDDSVSSGYWAVTYWSSFLE
ncbi:UbiA prenyltransferase family [Bipolaris maydis]|uniref:UbiA prenyltransferase family n=1 Tax=Cochliobolus heterostrophus TaxID=5016 RepID=UPI0024D8877E|nr:UbiA prenyltransferase family [Bipolaris maydis]KAJ6272541.1 UbiA prenyltransferase family [Bipolaris maydis]KAJ6279543.1 UbiA prenyltransferase family [Bipolaris maydis]